MTDWPFIRTWVHRPSVGSTNDLARALLDRGDDPLPLLVTADDQTAGRGRGSHCWWSDSGSLTATVAFDRQALGLQEPDEPKIALATAVAVVDALDSLIRDVPFRVRWPNDIEVHDRKLGGLLPERVQVSAGARYLVGIGLNVATCFDQAPSDIRSMAVSLSELAAGSVGPGLEPLAVLRVILIHLEKSLALLRDGDPAMATRWSELDSLAGRETRIVQGTNVVSGVARGIDPSGSLRLDCEGKIILIHGGQVLRNPPTCAGT